MKTKYPTPNPHVHDALIKAWADGAIVEIRYSKDVWDTLMFSDPLWTTSNQYRIYPECDYAKSKIAEVGGDDMVKLYLYWLDGGEIETKALNDEWKDADFNTMFDGRPFEQFKELLEYWDSRVRKKKRMVKQVLWVVCTPEGVAYDNEFFEQGTVPIGDEWHEVPSFTREVEING